MKDPDHNSRVNGVAASTQEGRWRAEFVPLPEGGTALIQVRAIPLSDNDGNGIGGSGGRAATY